MVKQSLEHEKTPEMRKKLFAEAKTLDPWTEIISHLTIPKLVEQLALNSAYEQQGETITLTLRESQAHLHSERAHQELTQALSDHLGAPCQLNIVIGEQGQTPLELREQLYQQRLEKACESLNQDKNVAMLSERFAAQLDEQSIRPI